jgi:hypothetical protein
MLATLSRLAQFRLDHAPSLLQGSHFLFRWGDDVLRECCEQLFTTLEVTVSMT